MNNINNTTKFGTLSILFHWLTFFLMVAVYFTIEFREFIPKEESIRYYLKILHFLLGLSILALVVPRLINFFKTTIPDIEPPHSHKQKVVAGFMYFFLYVMLIGMPLTGWFMLGAKAQTVTVLGIELPILISEDKTLAWVFEELHEIGGTLGYILIGLHVLAALFYHYFIMDNTLKRILPWKAK